jgi:hypothetical protein
MEIDRPQETQHPWNLAARFPTQVTAFIACLGRSSHNLFSLLRDVLVAAALSARDRAVAPFNRGSHHAERCRGPMVTPPGPMPTVASLRRRSLS